MSISPSTLQLAFASGRFWQSSSVNFIITMRMAFICLFALLTAIVSANEEKPAAPEEEDQKAPTTLAEAHASLERLLPAEELKKIHAMKSEREMSNYHFSLGMGMRNSWGLWHGSALSNHMRAHGFNHADDMSSVILETFWCKRHNKPFRLKERAKEYAAYWEKQRKEEMAEANRVQSAKQKMRAMMMNLKFNSDGVASVRMPDRVDKSIRARFLTPYNNGVLVIVRKLTGSGGDDFETEPYFFSSKDRKIHKVVIPELKEISSVMPVGRTLWVCGAADGESALFGLTAGNRVKVDLPKGRGTPQLGLHGETLLVVYPQNVYALEKQGWKVLYDGEIAIPRSGPPPRLIGNRLYLRDEGWHENNKRLWWLKLGPNPSLVSLDADVGVVGQDGPRWENSFSYAVSDSGDLWAAVGEGSNRKSLLRRSNDGSYSIAVMNNSVRFTPDLFGSAETDQGISVSSVTCSKDGSLLLVGDTGLFCLNGKVLTQKLAFTNTHQKIPIDNGKYVYHWSWDPSKTVVLEDGSYFISGAFGGVYLLLQKQGKEWSFESLDEELGEPVTW